MTTSTTRQLASFVVGDLLLGIEVERVQEVSGGTDITPVPLAPREIRGVMNLRGQIVTAIDLRRSLQLEDRQDDAPAVSIILLTADGCASLLVDDVGEVLEVDQADFEETPATVRGPLRELMRGAYKRDGRLLLLLDTDRVLNGIGELSC